MPPKRAAVAATSRCDLRVVADVGRREQHGVAELVREPPSALLVDVRDGDVRAGIAKARTTAAPISVAPPVTTAVLPSRPCIDRILRRHGHLTWKKAW